MIVTIYEYKNEVAQYPTTEISFTKPKNIEFTTRIIEINKLQFMMYAFKAHSENHLMKDLIDWHEQKSKRKSYYKSIRKIMKG